MAITQDSPLSIDTGGASKTDYSKTAEANVDVESTGDSQELANGTSVRPEEAKLHRSFTSRQIHVSGTMWTLVKAVLIA
jgi:hypothetical protein